LCPIGFTGPKCDVLINSIDPCASSPCENNGLCINNDGNYVCACLVGYAGDKCQWLDCCLNNPCKNSASCFNYKGHCYCSCPSQFTGYKCECQIGLNDTSCPSRNCCTTQTCQGRGLCRDGDYNGKFQKHFLIQNAQTILCFRLFIIVIIKAYFI
jgi:hypothetical protein